MIATNATNGPTEIIARLDRNMNAPVVFLAQTLGNGQLQAWRGDAQKLEFIPVHEYNRTLPLAKADEEMIAQRFQSSFPGSSVVLRQRLPRQPQQRPTLFAGNAPQLPAPAANNVVPLVQPQAPAATPAPAAAAQPAPAATPAPTAAAQPQAANVPASNMSSAELLDQIKATNDKRLTLATLVGDLTTQLTQATTEKEATETAYATLTAQYHEAVNREAEEEKQRREAALQAVLGGTTQLAAAAQQLHDTATQEAKTPAPAAAPDTPAQQAEAATQKGNAPVRGAGGKFQRAGDKAPGIARKTPAKGAARNKGGSRKPTAKPV
jgi:hypothetical protein